MSSPQRGEEGDAGDRPKRPWQPRFGMGGLFLVLLVVSVMAAAGSYLARTAWFSAPGQGKSSHFAFLLIVLAAPTLLMVTVAFLVSVLRRR